MSEWIITGSSCFGIEEVLPALFFFVIGDNRTVK